MKLFINNKRVRLVEKGKSLKQKKYDILLDSTDQIDLNKTRGHVLITNATNDKIDTFLKILELKKLENVKSFNFLVDSKAEAEKVFKKQFKIIKAAGGIVLKDDKLLLIHRLGNWDFPKGKLEQGEVTSEAGIREVEEECGVKAEIIEKLCATWHTYTDKDKKVLKKTTWYLMNCLDDSKLMPQTEEGIDKIEWLTPKEAQKALNNSYASVEYLMKRFNKLAKVSY